MNANEILDRMTGLRVLVLGDLMLDEYIHGRATRISPEAPVMVVRQDRVEAVPGGAANVAMNAAALGAQATVVGLAGQDEAGDRLVAALESMPGLRADVLRDASRVTTRKTRVLAGLSQQVLRIDHENAHPANEDASAALFAALDRALPDCDVVVLSDYAKGCLTSGVVATAIQKARDRGLWVTANPKPGTASRYRGASLVSLNRFEAAALMRDTDAIEQPIEWDEAEAAATEAMQKLAVDGVIVTLGEHGMAAAWQSGNGVAACRVAARRVEVADPAGAGDTVLATVSLGLAAVGWNEAVFDLASQAAASVVRHVGVAVPTPEDLSDIRSGRGPSVGLG